MEEIREKIMDLHRRGRCDLMYKKGRTNKNFITYGIEDNQASIFTVRRQAFRA